MWTSVRRAVTMTGPAAGVFVVLVVLWLAFSASLDGFATWRNAVNILDAASIPLIVATGMTFVVLTTGFDLSIGAILAGVGVLLGALLSHGHPLVLAIAVAILAALALGLVNGALIGVVGLDFFVVTLGTMSAFGGLSMLYTNGRTIPVESAFMSDLGVAKLAGLPVTVLIAAAICLASWVVLRYTAFGRSIYAIGNSREASRLAGLRVPLIACSAYVISGLLAGVAGVLEVARLTSASPNAGSTAALSAAAAVFLGGTALSGGIGGVAGTALGVLLLTTLANGLDLAGASSFLQSVITGVILIAAIGLELLRQRGLLARPRGRGAVEAPPERAERPVTTVS